MILLVAILLQLLYLCPLLWIKYRSRHNFDLFSPIPLVCVLHTIGVPPYLVMLHFDNTLLHPLIRNFVGHNLEDAVIWFGIIETIGFVSLLAGLNTRWLDPIASRIPTVRNITNDSRYIYISIFFLVIGGAAYLAVMRSLGGYESFASEMGQRQTLLAGSGYTMALLPTLNFAVLIVTYSMRYKQSRLKTFLLVAIILYAFVIFGSLGGRKMGIQLLIFVALTWHFGVHKIKRLPWQGYAVLLLLIPYFVALPLFRTKGAYDTYTKNPEKLQQDIVENLDLVVRQLSYDDTYIFITNYFNPTNLWLGKSYLDLPYAPIPRPLFPDKPPADDGFYIRNLAMGRNIESGTPQSQMFQASWPPETLGAAYLNFWIPGVILGMFLLGIVYRTAFKYMQATNYNLYSIILYGYFMTTFQFSNLRIMGVTTSIVVTTFFFSVLFGVRLKSISATQPVLVTDR